MIDTDKYEGHTEGKWILGEYKGRPSISAVEDVETPTWMRSIARGLNPSQTADHALIADAPLLLAEVKRLREAALKAREVLMKHYEWMSMNDATSEEDDQEILDTVKQLREASE